MYNVVCQITFSNTLYLLQTFNNDVQTIRPTVDNINAAAKALIRDSEPEMARSIQTKLDTINQHYSDLSQRNDKYSDTVTTTHETVTTVETLVDDFDDFVLPAVERLSSPQFMQQDTKTISRELEVFKKAPPSN